MQHIAVVRILDSPNGAMFSWKVWASFEMPVVWSLTHWMTEASLRRSQEKLLRLAKAGAAPVAPAPAK
jgi:hypothetical protein